MPTINGESDDAASAGVMGENTAAGPVWGRTFRQEK